MPSIDLPPGNKYGTNINGVPYKVLMEVPPHFISYFSPENVKNIFQMLDETGIKVLVIRSRWEIICNGFGRLCRGISYPFRKIGSYLCCSRQSEYYSLDNHVI